MSLNKQSFKPLAFLVPLGDSLKQLGRVKLGSYKLDDTIEYTELSANVEIKKREELTEEQIVLGSYKIYLWKDGEGKYNGNVSFTYDGRHPFTLDQERISLNYHSENKRRGDTWAASRGIDFPGLNVNNIETGVRNFTPAIVKELFSESQK